MSTHYPQASPVSITATAARVGSAAARALARFGLGLVAIGFGFWPLAGPAPLAANAHPAPVTPPLVRGLADDTRAIKPWDYDVSAYEAPLKAAYHRDLSRWSQTPTAHELAMDALYYDLALASAEPGSAVLVSYYKPFFALWAARYIDGSRTDLTIVNPQLFGYPGYLRSALAEHPELKRLAHAMIVKGEITEAAISELAYSRPVRVEPSPWVEADAFRNLLPEGTTYTAF
ncbi:MAG: hypothetical protein NTZ61_00855, partial [Proteobacteria bacterium]|nr:hypothetical protein [Pseudomonadota bacterium]